MAFDFYGHDEAGAGKKSDLRSQVSQRLIWDAMFSLLSEKPFDSVHVKDICERAHVNRSTFYNHFSDKFELLQFGLHEVILKEAGITLDGTPLTEPPHELLFDHVYRNQSFWKNVFLTPHARDFINETIIESSESFFGDQPSGTEAEASVAAYRVPTPIMARMYFGAIGNLTTWWLAENCKTPISQLNAWIDALWRFNANER